MKRLLLVLTAALAAPAAADAPRWTSVYLRIYSGTGTFYDISESSLRINLNGNKDSSNYFHFSGNVDNQFLSVSANPHSSQDPSRGYSVWGSGLNLSMSPNGNGFYVSGNVDSKYVSFTISRYSGGSYSIWGQGGMNLSGSQFGNDITVNGSIDLSQFDKKSLAALGVVLAATSAVPPR